METFSCLLHFGPCNRTLASIGCNALVIKTYFFYLAIQPEPLTSGNTGSTIEITLTAVMLHKQRQQFWFLNPNNNYKNLLKLCQI